MKKLALVLAVLLVVGGAAFAEVTVGGEATVAGSVSTTVGMDLENDVWGADADSSITLKVPFVNGSAGASGDDDVYGEVMISDIGVNWNSDEFEDADYDGTNFDGDISAKIVAGDIYVGLNWGGYNNNYAAGGSDYDVNLDDDWYAVPAFGDLAFGFNNGMFGIELEVAAKNGLTRAAAGDANEDFVTAWDGETAESDPTASTQTGVNGLVFSADVEYVSEALTFPVYATIDPDFGGDLLLGVSTDIAVVAGPATIALPADFVMIGDDMGFDAAPSVTLAAAEGLDVVLDAYYYNHVDVASLLDAGLSVTADGLVAGLTASVDLSLTDLMSSGAATADLGWGVDTSFAFAAADGLTVTVMPDYDSTGDFDFDASVEFGSAFTGIDNTVISLDYAGLVVGDVNDKGIVSCTATVSF